MHLATLHAIVHGPLVTLHLVQFRQGAPISLDVPLARSHSM